MTNKFKLYSLVVLVTMLTVSSCERQSHFVDQGTGQFYICEVSGIMKADELNKVSATTFYKYDKIGQVAEILRVRNSVDTSLFKFTRRQGFISMISTSEDLEFPIKDSIYLSNDKVTSAVLFFFGNKKSRQKFYYDDEGYLQKVVNSGFLENDKLETVDTFYYSWDNGDLMSIKSSKFERLFSYYQDYQFQFADYNNLVNMKIWGQPIYTTKHLIKSVEWASGQEVYEYKFDNQKKVKKIVVTNPHAISELNISYTKLN